MRARIAAPTTAPSGRTGRSAFGHRRLSIIDLTRGRQPMASADGAIVITFNGEIYNYLELRAELVALGHTFRTQLRHRSPAPRLPAVGHELSCRSCAACSRSRSPIGRRSELLLARDRFGEKPLLYLETAGGTRLRRELTPLSRIASGARSMPIALGRYLTLNYVPGDADDVRGRAARAAGDAGGCTRATGRIEQGTYWSPPTGDARSALSTWRAPSTSSTRCSTARGELTLRSDVPVGMFLSAGIDSSLVARAAVKAGRLPRAFSLGFEEQSTAKCPGRGRPRRSSACRSPRSRSTRRRSSGSLELVAHADDPLADSSALAVWTLAAEAAKHVKVVLRGDGGDELFGGYLTYPATLWHASVTSRLPMPVRARHGRGRSDGLPTATAR